MKNEQGVTKSLGMVAMDQLGELDTWWLWPQRIPMGNLTLLAGDQDAGKSRVAWDLAARVSRGDAWPDGEANPMGAGSVLLVSSENHLQIAARPALQAAGADMAKIVCAGSVHEKDKDGKKSKRPFDLRRDLDAMEALIVEMKDCRMLIIDSISSYLGSGGGAKTAELLRGLMDLAARYQVAVVGVTHLRRGNGEAIDRVVGGLALTTAARCIWALARSEVGGHPSANSTSSPQASSGQGRSEVNTGGDGSGEPSCRRLMLPVKNNLAAGVLGLGFGLHQDEGQKAPRVDWSADAVEMTADEAFAAVRASLKEQPKAVQDAMEYLKVALRDGPRLVRELEAEAKKQGISQITLRRARVALEVRKYREVIPGPWWVRSGGCREEDGSCQLPVLICQSPAASARTDDRALARPPQPRPFSPGVPGEKGAKMVSLGAGEDRREMNKSCENEDHVDHVGVKAEFSAKVEKGQEDHVDHLAEIAGDFAVLEQDELQEDPLLCGAGCGDRHETASIGELSIFGMQRGGRGKRGMGRGGRREGATR